MYALPDVVRWSTLWGTLERTRGLTYAATAPSAVAAGAPQLVPRVTNREAMAIATALRDADRAAFPLWYQYAALAYGWTPDTDVLITDTQQAEREYPPEATLELLLALQRSESSENLPADRRAFDDPMLQSEVVVALRGDGAEPSISIIPQCRDAKTGRARIPRPPCDDQGRGPRVRDPATGAEIELPCDRPGDCKPLRPIGMIGFDIPWWAILLGGWLLIEATRRDRRT